MINLTYRERKEYKEEERIKTQLSQINSICSSVTLIIENNQPFHFQTVGNKITPLVVNPGRIVLTNVTLYFQPYNNAEEKPVIKVKLASIKRIFQRRYLLRPLGKFLDFFVLSCFENFLNRHFPIFDVLIFLQALKSSTRTTRRSRTTFT